MWALRSQMSKTRTGALIVVEGNTRLGDIINSGTVLNAQMSEELLLNIFYPKSPLHDGAAIVRDSGFSPPAACCR